MVGAGRADRPRGYRGRRGAGLDRPGRAVPAPALGSLLQGKRLSARDHRENAERQAAAGDFTAAIVESVRAIAVDLEERGVFPARVGRTADELAAEASRVLPDHAAGLRDAARLFDDVRYGERAGTAAGYERLRDLGTMISAARPAAGPLPRRRHRRAGVMNTPHAAAGGHRRRAGVMNTPAPLAEGAITRPAL